MLPLILLHEEQDRRTKKNRGKGRGEGKEEGKGKGKGEGKKGEETSCMLHDATDLAA